jgi:hypothetical protein
MALTGFVERIKGKAKAHILYLGSGGIVSSDTGAQVLGGKPNDGVIAHAGGTRALAMALKYGWNRLATVASANDSVALPPAVAGASVVVINDGVAAAKVYAGVTGTDTIDGVAAATGVPLTNAKRAIFYCLTAGAWQSLQGGVSA